ncbi:MAG TPA: cell wall-binding repeat-containing protein, partial [Acidothermaceae bacterium]|nr:cell wall-binding repeat-containing protein [Acidothermaceae bacterium]
AVAVADALGNPSTVLLATGAAFPDALTAGPAAVLLHAAVLLSDGPVLPAETQTYLGAHPGAVYAIGGPAAAADPTATPIVGADRFATAVAVATRFFPTFRSVGLASGVKFPDALAGGVQVARAGGPLLLSGATGLDPSTAAALQAAKAGTSAVWVYGGETALGAQVITELDTIYAIRL